jgi:hypothetical protein
MTKSRGYGIVRTDITDACADAEVSGIRTLAAEKDLDLRAVFVEASDASFPLLVATLGMPGMTTVVVPSATHLAGWLDLIRQHSDIWTLYPPRLWPRRSVQEVMP